MIIWLSGLSSPWWIHLSVSEHLWRAYKHLQRAWDISEDHKQFCKENTQQALQTCSNIHKLLSEHLNILKLLCKYLNYFRALNNPLDISNQIQTTLAWLVQPSEHLHVPCTISGCASDNLYQPRNHMFILYIDPIDHCAIWTTLASIVAPFLEHSPGPYKGNLRVLENIFRNPNHSWRLWNTFVLSKTLFTPYCLIWTGLCPS